MVMVKLMNNYTPAQQAAIHTINQNISVSAGAGSGKTMVLVERYVNLLRNAITAGTEEQVSPNQILAITFTRKAANEMKERIRKRLLELEATEPANYGFWHKQLSEMDRARINTIHGFCSSILKENPLEAKLDPSFVIAEENDIREFLEATVTEFVRNGLKDPNGPVTVLAHAYTAEKLITYLITLDTKIDTGFDLSKLAEPYQISVAQAANMRDRLIECVNELATAPITNPKLKQSEYISNLNKNITIVTEAINNYTDVHSIRILDQYINCFRASGSLKDLIRESKDVLKALLNSRIDTAALKLLPAWEEVIRACKEHIRQSKYKQNILGFNDLEVLTLELLSSSATIRSKYQKYFKQIMVDEFQDTNERQRLIIYYLCGNDPSILSSNKLFIVGDPKQSIYRFRGADVSVFAQVRKDIIASGGQNIVLGDNFRSVDKVLNFCNELFPLLMGEDPNAQVYFEALNAHRNSAIEPEFLMTTYPKDEGSNKRNAEANQIAERIWALHNTEGIPYNDITILLNALTHADKFTEALKSKAIPFVLLDSRGFYDQQEIIDIMNLLTVCYDSKRDLELAGVLRSPYFAIDDEILTGLFIKLNFDSDFSSLYDLLANGYCPQWVPEPEKKRLHNSFTKLSILKYAAATLPLLDFIEKIKTEINPQIVLSAQTGGRTKYLNLNKFFNMAGEFAAEKQSGLKEFLIRIKKLRAAKTREDAVVDARVNDGVTIMTIHKSKGLEFPVVVLPALDAPGNPDKAEVNFNKENGLGIKAFLDGKLQPSTIFNKNRDIDKDFEAAEYYRKFYVAMTRARDRLIMSAACCEDKKFSTDNLLGQLHHLFQNKYNQQYKTIPIANNLADMPSQPTVSQSSAEEPINVNINPLPEYLSREQHIFTASSLQLYESCPRAYYYKYLLNMPAIQPQSISGTGNSAQLLGVTIHKALEIMDGNDYKTALNVAANEFLLSKALKDEAEVLLSDYIAGSFYQQYKDLPQEHEVVFFEKLLSAYENEQICSGIIDCVVFNNDNTISITDYKTGIPPADYIKQGYLYQLALYAAAAKILYNLPIKEVQLYYLRNSTAYKITQEQIEPTLKEISALLTKITQNTAESDYNCERTTCDFCPYNYFCPQK